MDKNTLVDKIIRYEDGSMDLTEIVELFQYLVDTGKAWTLQGSYGRAAEQLIESGMVEDTSWRSNT